MEAEAEDIRTVIAHGFGAWANVYRERRLAMGVIQRMSQKKEGEGDISLGAFVHLGQNANGPMIMKSSMGFCIPEGERLWMDRIG